MAAETGPQAPPRRSGRGCGYEGQARLLAANRQLGAALTRLARDPEPGPRAVGAELASMVARLVEQAAHAAGDSTSKARRAQADVARRLDQLDHQIGAAAARARHLSEASR